MDFFFYNFTKRMQKLKITLLLFLCPFSFIPQEVVSTQGESYLIANTSIVFTIGEVVVNTGFDGVIELTQGFHQTNLNLTAMEDHNPSFNATIFPNPTTDILNIKTSMFEGVTYSIYNAQGKLILRDKLYFEQTPVNVRQFTVGAYLLKLNAEEKKQKTYKLIKRR